MSNIHDVDHVCQVGDGESVLTRPDTGPNGVVEIEAGHPPPPPPSIGQGIVLPSPWVQFAEELGADPEKVRTNTSYILRWAYEVGLWPAVIAPKGAIIKTREGDQTADGKTPLGKGWGAERTTLKKLNYWLKAYRNVGTGPGACICLGPGRAPGGLWLIDVEIDGGAGIESLGILFGDEAVNTMGWASTRGGHRLFVVDGERLLSLLSKAGAEQGKGKKRGVWKLKALPDLELRIGGYKDDGNVLQFQSVVPPSVGDNGEPREWNEVWEIAPLPESAYTCLERLASDQAPAHSHSRGGGGGGRRGKGRRYARAALSDAARKVAATRPGERHDALRHESMALAGLVANGSLSPTEFREEFIEADRANGHAADDPGDARGLLDGALKKATPRAVAEERVFRNWDWDDDGDDGGVDSEGSRKSRPVGLCIQLIELDLTKRFSPGWPKRVGETLFVQTDDYQPVYLDSPSRLFAWIDSIVMVDWKEGANFVSQARFYEHLRMTTKAFDAIETLPHWPPIPGVYYMHRPNSGGGPSGRLDELVGFFSPLTTIDTQLIKSFILTLFWGGEKGKRPAFLAEGPEGDEKQGRGVGKSAVFDILSEELAGGYINVLPTDEMFNVIRRLLSNENGRRRVCRLDNLKSHRFSWADLEGIITCPTISGHKMMVGEGRRPNTLIWVITLNGASFSKDMALRTIPIKLARPNYDAGWDDRVREFCREHLAEILDDIRILLEQSPLPIDPKTRWGAWSRDILTKLPDYPGIEKEIRKRQDDLDSDEEEKDLVIDYIRNMLAAYGFNPDTQAILIPSSTICEWIQGATNKKLPTNHASAFLKGLSILNLKKSDRKGKRNWIWTGNNAKPGHEPLDLHNPPKTAESGGSDQTG